MRRNSVLEELRVNRLAVIQEEISCKVVSVDSGKLYAVKAGVVCLQVELCDPHLSALEVMFSQRGAIQIYLYL